MKTIKAEILMIEGAPFPVIKEIYDQSNENDKSRNIND